MKFATIAICAFASLACGAALAQNSTPFIGNWALTLPNNGPGWLGVTQENGALEASLLWYGGSVTPLDSVFIDGDTLFGMRTKSVDVKDASGNVVRKITLNDIFSCKVSGEEVKGSLVTPSQNQQAAAHAEFTGKRIPALPEKPDLSKVKFGKPIKLIAGKNLKGWTPTDPQAKSGWSVEKGVLINNAAQEEGKPHVHYTNLRTEKEFEDFNLKLEVNVPQNGNSGVYLRGIYEVQVFDSFGKPLDSHNMGAIYSRITPTEAAEKPAGEWQTMDITLVDRHVTVKLNDKTIVDNQPLLGCTGGALWSDEFRPGPIYLQGDHTSVKYRNIVLTPVVK